MARTETMGRARKTPTCEKSGVVFVGGGVIRIVSRGCMLACPCARFY